MSKTAFVFPGQGAQKAGMGKDFYDKYQTAKKIYDEASEALDLDMRELCFYKNDRLDQTEYTQAALVCTCLSMEGVLKEKGLRPDITAGLSLGEYAAIAASGGMSTKDAIIAVRQRGILMEEAVPKGVGAMAAVIGLEADKIEAVLSSIDDASIANYNCPGQIVITGRKASVEEASIRLKEAGARRVLPLNVSGPFHSALLKEASGKLLRVLDGVPFKPLDIPYVTNVDATVVDDIARTSELLGRQIYSSVLWQQSVEKMLDMGVDTFVEIGPGKTLSGFIKKIKKDAVVYNIQTVEDMDTYIAAVS